MMKVAEKFVSINGEGTRAGELSVFIRFKGCNLRCTYCDTMWANEADCPCEEMTPAQIAQYVLSSGITNVTLTGGEPLLQREIAELVGILIRDGKCRVEIETNGAADLRPLAEAPFRPVFTMDYKLPSSGCEKAMRAENFTVLGPEDTVKFVAGSAEDLARAAQIIEKYALVSRCHVYFSPVFGKIDPADIVEFMIRHRMNDVRLQIQMHKVIWDPMRRGFEKMIDERAIEEHIRGILTALGDDPEREGLKDTPKRVAQMYAEVFAGMNYTNHEIAEMFGKTFEEGLEEDDDGSGHPGRVVVMRDIDMFSYCEHHMALMYDMKATVAYVPKGRVIGLSKIARVCDMVGRRLQLQEKIGMDIADILTEITGSEDVAVTIEACHSCVTARGIKKTNTKTYTAELRGRFRTDPALQFCLGGGSVCR